MNDVEREGKTADCVLPTAQRAERKRIVGKALKYCNSKQAARVLVFSLFDCVSPAELEYEVDVK